MTPDTDDIELVPAAPGFDVLLYRAEDKSFLARPVIAWAVTRTDDCEVRAAPIAVSEVLSLNEDWPIRLPDGQVVWGDAEWATAEEWAAEMQRKTPINVNISPLRDAPVLALDAFRGKFQG